MKAVEALKNNDVELFGKLMNASHTSLQFDYEVTGVELDTLVEEAWKVDGVIGSRMTGAGFGGCTVSIVKADAIDSFIEKVGKAYKEKIGYAADFYVVEIGDGPAVFIRGREGQPDMIEQDIKKLVAYGLQTGLVEKEDEIYTVNRLLELFGLDEIEDGNVVQETSVEELEEVLGRMMDYAVKEGIMKEDGIVYRDLFDTKIMSMLVPRPSEVIRKFWGLYEQGPEKANGFLLQVQPGYGLYQKIPD